MRLSEDERRVIHCVQLRAKLSLPQAAKELKMREHRVRYILHKLCDKRVLHPVALINLGHAGYLEFGAYFSLRHTAPEKQRAVKQYLLEEIDVPWFSELGGDFQFALALRKTHLADVTDFFDSLSARFGAEIYDLSIHVRSTIRFVPYWFPQDENTENKTIGIHACKPTVQIDKTDAFIVHALERNGARTHQSIATELGLAQSTVSERIHRLEKQGIIAGYMYAINHRLIGQHMFELFIHANTNDPEMRQAFHSFATLHPRVMYSVDGIGTWQFELGVAAEQAPAVHELVNALYENFPRQITKVSVVPILKTKKVSLRVIE